MKSLKQKPVLFICIAVALLSLSSAILPGSYAPASPAPGPAQGRHTYRLPHSRSTPVAAKAPAPDAALSQSDTDAAAKARVAYQALPAATQPHPVIPYHALVIPDDPRYSLQPHLAQIGAPTAWNTTTGSATTTIAVIDTGFALANPELSSRWYTNPDEMGSTTQEGPTPNCTSRGLPLDKSCNNLDNDGDGYASDWRGWDFTAGTNEPQAGLTSPDSGVAYHGTFVASLAAASGNNGAAGAGIDWNARIMPLQALDDDGFGDTNTVGAAIAYAADHGANVINLSLGASSSDPYLQQQIQYAVSKGVVVVAAAGNDGCADCVSYPAAYSEVVAVGATNTDGTLASFSSYGPELDIVAPGTSLCATSWTPTHPADAFVCGPSGTSFSSPLVAGAISLLISAGAPPDIARQFITLTADKLDGMGPKLRTDAFGFGRLNVGSAMAAYLLPTASPDGNSLVRVPCSNPATSCFTILVNADNTTTEITSLKNLQAVDYMYLVAGVNTPPAGVYTLQSASGNAVANTAIRFSP